MQPRELSKMQIRAEVLMILQKLSAFDEVPKAEIDKYCEKLKSIENRRFVIEVLAKELSRVEYKKGQVIAMFLSEIATLDLLKDQLWAYIKDPSSSDSLKDLSGIILRNLGDNSDPEEFLSYLNNPDEIIDRETQRLLESALVNPESQIDFLDFLFSMPDAEQISLVESLRKDYSGNYLANILSTALEFKPSQKIQELMISALGETRSPFAKKVLYDIIKYSQNPALVKLAKKSLNELKLAGIDINTPYKEDTVPQVCQISSIYECYASVIDGVGNQGLIISRIKKNKSVLVFSVVVNDTDGILDCFGFYGISKDDFQRIIARFNEESARVSVDAKYCRYILDRAENINRTNDKSIPYEYTAWKMLLKDVSSYDKPLEESALDWVKPESLDEGEILYKYPDFKYWFIDEEDYPVFGEFFQKVRENVSENEEIYRKNPEKLLKWLENEITGYIPVIFNQKIIEIYRKRLLNTAYLFDLQGLESLKSVAASVAEGLSLNTPNNKFIRNLLKKSLIEGFLRYQQNIGASKPKSSLSWLARKAEESNNILDTDLRENNLADIVDILYNEWSEN